MITIVIIVVVVVVVAVVVSFTHAHFVIGPWAAELACK
jgi:hypothetical protein